MRRSLRDRYPHLESDKEAAIPPNSPQAAGAGCAERARDPRVMLRHPRLRPRAREKFVHLIGKVLCCS